MIKIDGRKKTKRAQTQIGPAIERHTALREDGRCQLQKVRLQAPLEKNVPHLRVAQVNIGFGRLERNPEAAAYPLAIPDFRFAEGRLIQ